VLPFARERFEAMIRASGRGAEASIRGFARGWDAMQRADANARPATASAGAPASLDERASAAGAPSSPVQAFPAPTREFVRLGCARLAEFQDRAYAGLYLRRVTAVLDAERRIDPAAANGYALTRETARFLALWMAFDDLVRVADLKSRASRFARVRREVGAGDGDVVRIVDYFRPGVPEVASLLPPALAGALAAWERRRVRAGKGPWSMPVALAADSVSGFLVLRTLASLRRLRRRGARFGQEQALIERWLGAIVTAAGTDWRLAHETALCGRLVKGYGATNARSKENLLHILDHVVAGGTPHCAAERARAVRDAREAALADEGGKALDLALARHGAPPRPVKPQPVLWTKRPTAGGAPSPSRGS
jgi:indolepyruvate ferredoxin oxidoreductase beta subunit